MPSARWIRSIATAAWSLSASSSRRSSGVSNGPGRSRSMPITPTAPRSVRIGRKRRLAPGKVSAPRPAGRLWSQVHRAAAMSASSSSSSGGYPARTVILPRGKMTVRAGYPPEDELDEADIAAARWTWDHNRPAGRGADTLPGAKRLFLPMRTERGAVGVIGIDRDRPGPLLTPDDRRLLDALSDQAAVAIERIHLAEGIDEARVQAETERLRATLLSSISHDLRTPLASIIGSITALKNADRAQDAAIRDTLIATIRDEADRLNRFVGNLLDITRLEGGTLQFNREMVDFAEVVETALRRAARMLSQHRLQVDLAPNLPMIHVDIALLEQVLFNLLDNASKYAPQGSLIHILARQEGDAVTIEVQDEGEGIPPEQLEQIFDKFHRVRDGDTRTPGTGLGLAICRGFIEGMGGRIFAANRADRAGARFTIELPVGVETQSLSQSA